MRKTTMHQVVSALLKEMAGNDEIEVSEEFHGKGRGVAIWIKDETVADVLLATSKEVRGDA